MKSFFSVDLGATSGRTILGFASEDGIKMEEINRFPNHLIHANGHYYWDIYELYRNIIEGLKLVAQRKDIHLESIGIDTWGVDFVMVGKDGGFLRMPYAYRDSHTVGAAEHYFQHYSAEDTYQRTGIQVMDFNSLFQFHTLRRNDDAALNAADKILFMPDALSYMLTGKMVTEYTIASTAQIVNAEERVLDAKVLETVGLTADHFGRFVYPGELVGTLTKDVQQMTGLGAVPVVAVAGHDTASAVAAVPAYLPDFAYLSSGTWSLMGIESKKPIINDQARQLNYTNEGGVEGTIRVLKNICGMWLLERCRENWGEVTYEQLIQEALSAKPLQSIINPDDSAFANPLDMEKEIKTYCQRTNQHIPETRGELTRCIFESLVLRYREVLEDLEKLSGHKVSVLHVIGGGSKNDLLNQWTANSIGRPVVAGPAEATALGNIMMQLWASEPTMNLASLRKLASKGLELKTFVPCGNMTTIHKSDKQ